MHNDCASDAATHAQPDTGLLLGSEENVTQLDTSGSSSVKLDRLGPMVVNSDGVGPSAYLNKL